jgi:hypothetical protein
LKELRLYIDNSIITVPLNKRDATLKLPAVIMHYHVNDCWISLTQNDA